MPIKFAAACRWSMRCCCQSDHAKWPVQLMVDTGASQGIILRYPFANDHWLLELAGQTDTTAPTPGGW